MIKEHEVDWSPLADIKPARVGRGYSTFSLEEGERIREFWLRNNIPAAWIARHFGLLHHTIIHNVLNRSIKYERPRVRLMSGRQMRKAWLQHKDGKALKTLAREIGTTAYGLEYQFKRRGWPLFKAKTLVDRHAGTVAELSRKGHTIKQIAERLGVSTCTVSMCRHKIREDIERSFANGNS